MSSLVEEKRARLTELCRRYRVEQLAVFGSAATDTFDPATSDLDFLVSFAPMPPVEHADAYFGLLEALEALFSREIDLLEEEAIENPYLRRSIDASRVPLYAAWSAGSPLRYAASLPAYHALRPREDHPGWGAPCQG